MENSKMLKKVLEKFKDRESKGLVKYGTTMDRDDLSFFEWLNHLQEELMDATLYIEKLKAEHQELVEEKAITLISGTESAYSWGPDVELHEEERERRMRIIGQNGNDGLHYEEDPDFPDCGTMDAMYEDFVPSTTVLYPGDITINYDNTQ